MIGMCLKNVPVSPAHHRQVFDRDARPRNVIGWHVPQGMGPVLADEQVAQGEAKTGKGGRILG
jgi:hypothetical protein